MRSATITLIILLFALKLQAQLHLGLGSSLGIPFFVGKQGYYNTPSAGVGLQMAYRPPLRKIYPSVTGSVQAMRLPLFNSLLNDVNVAATSKSVMLDLNYILGAEGNIDHFVYNVGIGIAHVTPHLNGVVSNASSLPGHIQIVEGSNNNTHPVINTGITYFKRISSKHLYLSFDLRLKYIRLTGNDKYEVVTSGPRYPANMNGSLLIPTGSIQLNYFFERKEY